MSASAVLRRRLAAALRDLRTQRGLSQEEVANALGTSARTIIRTEKGETALSASVLCGFLDVCEADRETKERLTELGKHTRRRGGWWSPFRDIFPGPYLQFEDEGALVRNYEPLLVPGLLQTEEYVREGVTPQPQRERYVEVRMRRQRRITTGDLQLRAVIDEAVLYRIGDGKTAHNQLRHLFEATRLPNVTVRVVTKSPVAHPAIGYPFVIVSFPSAVDRDVAMMETLTGERYAIDTDEVAMCNRLFGRLEDWALNETDSTELIREYLKP